MKVVFPTCCGVDVHKTFVVATIITTPADSLQPHYQKKRFSTFNSDLNHFADWLLEHNCLDVCMESTGKYWVPVFNILEKRGIRIVIANPKWVKAVKGNKDDTKDSKWIGDLFRIGLVKSSFIPELNIRILREFLRYRYKLVSMKSSEKNRFQNAFTVCNVALDSVVSDMFGKSATAITDYLTSDESFDLDHCVSLLQHSLKKKAEKVLESIEGYSISDEQKARIKIIREHYDFVEKLISKVDTCVNEMVETSETAQNALSTWKETSKIFEQGREYYDKLRKVNDLISGSEKVKESVLMLSDISEIYVNNFGKMLTDKNFSQRELNAIAAGYNTIMKKSSRSIAELKNIINPTGMSMNDKERIDLVNRVYREMTHYKELANYYTRKNLHVSYLRAKEKNEQQQVFDLYGKDERYW